MKSLGLCSATAFAVSSTLVPFTIALSQRCGAVSETGGRHVGQRPIGRLGGIGVVLGIMVAMVVLSALDSTVSSALRLQFHQIIGLILGVVLVGGVGFWDDIRRLPAKSKLLVHVVAAVIAFRAGLKIQSIDLPFFEPFALGWLAFPVTILWVIGIVNAVNLIDGLDGLAAGVVFFASIVNFVAAICSESILSAGLMAAVAGAVVGFLVYNWYPAKIYLGDGGAYSLGFILATSALISPHQKASTSVTMLVPVLAAGLPVFDTSLTMLRRFLNDKGIFTPDRGHLHHVLLDAGISHRRVVIGLYTISFVFGSVAIAVVLNRSRFTGVALIVVSMAGFLFWVLTERKKIANIAKKP
jgi:UDP-GlcNAc:undecaprenyl-phosphate GlcNAc-1-phosphate transferase